MDKRDKKDRDETKNVNEFCLKTEKRRAAKEDKSEICLCYLHECLVIWAVEVKGMENHIIQ